MFRIASMGDKVKQVMNTTEAAEYLGITRVRVRQLIQADSLKATKVGRDWVIRYGDLVRFAAHRRGPGRPRKRRRVK